MTIARIATFAFAGIDPVPVEVQVQIAPGLPAFLLVGLPDKAVTESRERVRAALTGLGLSLPPRRVLVNLAPADILKEGSHFDLPIALALLAAMEIIPKEDAAGYAALGELSLDGSIVPVAGVLPAALGASARDLGLICPAAQGGEAAWAEGVGEHLTPLPAEESWCLVIHPGCEVPTAAVFKDPQLTRDTPAMTIAALPPALTHNDCEPVTRRLYPAVGAALDWLGGYAPARMSGTGACLFASFATRDAALDVGRQVPAAWTWFVARRCNRSPLLARLAAEPARRPAR